MATNLTSQFIDRLRGTLLPTGEVGLTDGELLSRYLAGRDGAALSALMHRHAPMVWGVCRRVLHHRQDAEDAFQATFLVLVRRADSIVPPGMVANWLYGVAYQTALKARATAAKRRTRERQVSEMPQPEAVDQDQTLWRDLRPLIDEELSRLPDKYRALIVLCDLEGKTRGEAARHLGCPEGTVAGRLARARAMLAKNLSGRGVVLSGGVLALVLARNAAAAGVPASVVVAAVKAVNLSTVGEGAAGGMISSDVARLTEGVLNAMSSTKLKLTTAMFLGVLIVGGGTFAHRSGAMDQTPQTQPRPAETARPEGKERTLQDAKGPGKVKTPDEEYKEMAREYDEGARETEPAVRAAKTAEEKEAIWQKHNQRGADFARRFLELARRDPKHTIGWDAAMWVLNNAGDQPELKKEAASLMAEHHPFHKYMGNAVGTLVTALPEPKGVELARTVMERHPDQWARGMACLALARHWKRQVKLAWRCEEEPEKAAEALGREKVDRLRKEAGAMAKEAERMYGLAAEKYGDAKYGKSGTLAEVAKRELSILRNAVELVVGKVAPETEGTDIDRKPLKLGDYRGKVVVVTYWATWCGPCMRMVPHERELVERLKDKPFALLGVNNDRDEDREKVKERIKKDQITWRSWWDGGPEGPIATRWCVEGWPTVYVLDAKGVIRYKNVTGDRLDEAVDTLLKELEGKKDGVPPDSQN